MIEKKKQFPDKALWNNLLVVCDAAVRSSIASSFNKCFSCDTTCLVYKTKSSDTIRDAVKNKLSTCSLRWDPSDICTKTWTICLNQTRQNERSFTAFVLTTDSRATESESERTSVSSADKIAAVNVIFVCFWCNARIQRDQVSAVKRVNAGGWSLWREEDYLSMFCSGGVFMQTTVPRWHHLAPQIQTSRFWSLIKQMLCL